MTQSVKLFYKNYGESSNETLLILHGLFGSLDNWHLMAKALSETFHVITLDLRNHGKSPHTQTMDYQSMAMDVRDLILQTGKQKVHILGHSMGGKVAMALSKYYPELINKMMVVDISPRQYKAGHLDIFKAMYALDLGNYTRRSEAEAALGRHIKDRSIALFILKNIERAEDHGFRWKINLDVIKSNYLDIIDVIDFEPPFKNPVMFVKGQLSPYILPQDKNMIEKLYPNSKIKEIENAGHWVHADKPKKLLKTIADFL